MELINVFLVFGRCQGALVTPRLPLPPLFQVSTILHVSCILGPFYNNKKFMWPSTTYANNKLVAYYHCHFFFSKKKKKNKRSKKNQRRRKRKRIRMKRKRFFLVFFNLVEIFISLL
jgi:hypothetical protein